MDNKIIDKLLCEKMNFTPEQIDTITFICKEVYKDMELNKETRNDYSNFARGIATAEPVKENDEKINTIPYNSVTKSNARDPSAFYQKIALMRNVMAIMEYLNFIFENGSCVKTDTKTLSIYKNNLDKLISENTDVSIDLDSLFKKWEIQLSKYMESYNKPTVGFYSIKCELRLSLNNELSISRFFDYRKPTDQRLIFALLLYMKLRFKNKGWDLNNISFKEISDKIKLSSIVVAAVPVPCVVFKFVYNKPKQEPKLAAKSKGGKK